MNWDAVFSLLGSAIGCIAGIAATRKLTVYRLEQLEKKVDKHNNLVERMAVAELQIREIKERID